MNIKRSVVALTVLMMTVGVAVAQSPAEVAVSGGEQTTTEVAASGNATAPKTETIAVTATTESVASNEINVVPATPAKPAQVAPVRKIEEMVVDT
ncbi:MAG: hypothetical protein II307_05680, partial [Alistipes sp.]|nr:hypothetical protein [Alistipes sp.]